MAADAVSARSPASLCNAGLSVWQQNLPAEATRYDHRSTPICGRTKPERPVALTASPFGM